MIKLLEKSDIEKYWELIEYAVVGKLEPVTSANSEQIKKALIDSVLCCHAILEPEKDEPLRGFIISAISRDILTGDQSLLVLGAFAVLEVSEENWADVMVTLTGFAASNNCGRVIAYTQNDQLINLVEKIGLTHTYAFLSLELKEK